MNSFLSTIDFRAVFLVLAMFGAMQYAHADQALATKNGCIACHAVDKKLVGPSYKDVAKKYSGVAGDRVSALAVNIQKGGSGKWGPIPMPAQPQLSANDAKKLATWILDIK